MLPFSSEDAQILFSSKLIENKKYLDKKLTYKTHLTPNRRVPGLKVP